MTGFDDLVAQAKKERDADHARDEFHREWAQKYADRAVAEVTELGLKAAARLREGRVPTVPIIEFGTGLFGRPRIVETGQVWRLSSGILSVDGAFLDNRVVAAGEAVVDGPREVTQRRLAALKKAGISEEGDVVIGPAKPSVHIGEFTAARSPVAYLWRQTLEYLPISNDNALCMTGGRHKEAERPAPVAELIARDVAALLDARS